MNQHTVEEIEQFLGDPLLDMIYACEVAKGGADKEIKQRYKKMLAEAIYERFVK